MKKFSIFYLLRKYFCNFTKVTSTNEMMKKLSTYIHTYLFTIGLIAGFSAFIADDTQAQEKPKVMVLEIKDEIDPRMSRYVRLGIAEAKNSGADYIVIDMNTYGGRVDNADEIASAILDFDKPVYAFINNNAASAGAWISIACDSIYMVDGATIGAATVVTGDGQAAPDKYQSYMRGKMRATAAANGRDPKIAEAMVDQRIEIDGVIEAGKVLTFSTDEAIANDYCDAKLESIEAVLEANNIKSYKLVTYELSTIEKIIRVFLNPFLSGILLLIILGGIYFELQTPGVGFPILAAGIAATLYFIPYYLTGLAANWELDGIYGWDITTDG